MVYQENDTFHDDQFMDKKHTKIVHGKMNKKGIINEHEEDLEQDVDHLDTTLQMMSALSYSKDDDQNLKTEEINDLDCPTSLNLMKIKNKDDPEREKKSKTSQGNRNPKMIMKLLNSSEKV